MPCSRPRKKQLIVASRFVNKVGIPSAFFGIFATTATRGQPSLQACVLELFTQLTSQVKRHNFTSRLVLELCSWYIVSTVYYNSRTRAECRCPLWYFVVNSSNATMLARWSGGLSRPPLKKEVVVLPHPDLPAVAAQPWLTRKGCLAVAFLLLEQGGRPGTPPTNASGINTLLPLLRATPIEACYAF